MPFNKNQFPCLVCGRPVDTLITYEDETGFKIKLIAECHGKQDRTVINKRDIWLMQDTAYVLPIHRFFQEEADAAHRARRDNEIKLEAIETRKMKISTLKDQVMLWTVIFLMLILFLLLPITPWVIQSHFEAAAYNRITGQHVTTWDAMWVELRVDSGPSSNTGSK